MLSALVMRSLSKCSTLCLLALCMFVGCNDLPETNYPLLPTPQGEVVSQADGRGSYDWKIEKGKFAVDRQLEPNYFSQVNRERVQALIASAFSQGGNPTTFDIDSLLNERLEDGSSSLGSQLRLAIEAFFHPASALPAREVSLTHDSKPFMAKRDAIMALNEDGSRLLLVEDKLTLWDTHRGQLIKELASPTAKAKFAFLTPSADQAILFDDRKGYRLSFDGTEPKSVELSKREIEHVVASDKRDVFFVHSGIEVVRLDEDLSLNRSTPKESLGDEGLLAMSGNAEGVVTFDGGFVKVTVLGNEQYAVTVSTNLSNANRLIIAPKLSTYAVMPQEIQQVWAPVDPTLSQTSSFRSFGQGCQTSHNIVRAMPAMGNDPGSVWITLCVERLDAQRIPEECYVIDVNMEQRLVTLPTVLGKRQPELFEFSGDGRVLVTANSDEPVKVTFRGPRVKQHAEVDALVECIAELILQGHNEEAEQWIDRLEKYVASSPYTLRTRKLLDLKSPVAKFLAMSSDFDAAKELKPELSTFLDSGTTLADLVRAARLANRKFQNDIDAWKKNKDEVQSLVEKLLASEHPPLLAFEIWTNLVWIMKQEPEQVAVPFVVQLERDPLNPRLHVCMTSYCSPEKAGDIGQSGAYLKNLCEMLPAEQRDAFYCLQVLMAARALTRENSLGFNRLVPVFDVPVFDLNTPYSMSTLAINGQMPNSQAGDLHSTLGIQRSRVSQGFNELLKKESVWELPQSLWGELPRMMPEVATSELVDEHLRRYPITFGDEFTTWLRSEFQRRRK